MKISIIGTGNLATHLSAACGRSGVQVLQVWGRNAEKAKAVAAISGAAAISGFHDLNQAADLTLLAVADDAIAEMANSLAALFGKSEAQPVVVHLSGATPMAVLQAAALKHYGVFWPLQSFRSGKTVDFKKVPICINASDDNALASISRLARLLSEEVCTVSEEQRQTLHLAAVFVNNFTNHLLTISKELIDEAGVPFKLLKPLLRETVNRLDEADPQDMQTGPAIRGDLKTIERHMHLLAAHPRFRQLYALLSESIRNRDEATGVRDEKG
ncbi:MAG: DUF2520 domain-containing protein [Saprospiraceae bacterium]